jgi:hypothetical protein
VTSIDIDQAETDLYEILGEFLDPAEIEAEARKLLANINHEDAFTVRRIASEISQVIASEYEMQEHDMTSVIPRLDAILSPLCDWLVREAGANSGEGGGM